MEQPKFKSELRHLGDIIIFGIKTLITLWVVQQLIWLAWVVFA